MVLSSGKGICWRASKRIIRAKRSGGGLGQFDASDENRLAGHAEDGVLGPYAALFEHFLKLAGNGLEALSLGLVRFEFNRLFQERGNARTCLTHFHLGNTYAMGANIHTQTIAECHSHTLRSLP